MNRAPRVSVLMPVRDAATTLPYSLASVTAQRLRAWELLAVDDHSTDGSRQLLQAAATRDTRIRLIDNDGEGLVDALNTGLHQARAPVVARLDADDLMSPHRLRLQWTQMQRDPALTVLGCRVQAFPAPTAGSAEYLRWQNECCTPQDMREEIFVEAPFAHPTVMMRRDRILRAGGYRSGDFPEDYELWLRLCERNHKMAKLAQTLVYWRDTPTRLSRTDGRYRREAFDRLRAEYLARDRRLRSHRRAFAIWGAGRRTRQRCAHLLRQGFQPSAWIDIDLRKIGNRIDSIPVCAPSWIETHRPFVLGYVAAHGARDNIATWLQTRGYRRGTDYLMVG